jgi:hypothetical protein
MSAFPSCREMCELSTEDMEGKLEGAQWLGARAHLLICFYCRRYRRQMRLAVATVNGLATPAGEAAPEASPELKAAVLARLREKKQQR